MTEPEISGQSSAFAAYLGRYRECFLQQRTKTHFDNYCRGLLSDLPGKSVEPIALASGTAVSAHSPNVEGLGVARARGNSLG